jgi:hypothetical protein
LTDFKENNYSSRNHSRDGKILSAFQAHQLETMTRLIQMKIEGFSDFDIQKELGVSERNYRRLYDNACAQEHGVIVQHHAQDTVRAMALLKTRLEELYRIDKDGR